MNGPTDKVKIGRFLEMGIPLRGVVHVGTNEGYEIQWYLQLGLKVIGFEPHPWAAARCHHDYPQAVIHQAALGASKRLGILQIAQGDGCGSTFLPSLMGDRFIGTLDTIIHPMTDFDIPLDFDCLVVDVQGMELEVLKGAEPLLGQFKCLNIECSRIPCFEGEAPAQEVIDWLAARGFMPITPICDHDDILFVRHS